jgi:hypothetical protein
MCIFLQLLKMSFFFFFFKTETAGHNILLWKLHCSAQPLKELVTMMDEFIKLMVLT